MCLFFLGGILGISILPRLLEDYDYSKKILFSVIWIPGLLICLLFATGG
jgi:hypothetical protein